MENRKIAVVTGATSGIGYATVQGLLDDGFYVIGVGRSVEKNQAAEKKLRSKQVKYFLCDLSNTIDLLMLANDIKSHIGERGIDVLINNAGAFYSEYTVNEEGVEMQFAVNVIAPMYLSLMLYDRIKQANGRIVNVGSSSHYNTTIKWTDLQLSRNYRQLKAYKQTKLFLVLISRAFNQHSKGVKMFVADPGLVNTQMGFKETKGLAKKIWNIRKNRGKSTQHGAKTSIYLATAPRLGQALYYKDSQVKAESRNAQNDAYAKRIWDYCEQICGVNADAYINAIDSRATNKGFAGSSN